MRLFVRVSHAAGSCACRLERPSADGLRALCLLGDCNLYLMRFPALMGVAKVGDAVAAVLRKMGAPVSGALAETSRRMALMNEILSLDYDNTAAVTEALAAFVSTAAFPPADGDVTTLFLELRHVAMLFLATTKYIGQFLSLCIT